jgi:DNA polymerase alpha subunit B
MFNESPLTIFFSFHLQLDLRHARHWEFKKRPDILICPSRLSPFAKDVMGTVAINPGTLAKGVSGGTYANIHITPYSEDTLKEVTKQGIEAYPHNTSLRTAVEIVKI